MIFQSTTQSIHRYTPAGRRYTGPSAREVAAQLPGSNSHSDAQGRFRLRGWCHHHGSVSDSASLSIWDNPNPQCGIIVHCFVGCDRQTVIKELEQATGLQIWDAWESSRPGPDHSAQNSVKPPGTGTMGDPGRSQTSGNLQPIASALWAAHSEPIPKDPGHPARRWFAARKLWRPDLPAPGVIRWLPAAAHYQGRGPHTGAGSIIALMAPRASWTAAWPGLPNPQAVHVVAITADGTPAMDRPADSGGLGKRSIGSTSQAMVLIGCPEAAGDYEPVRVAEGLADALAIASRYPGIVVATMGTALMSDPGLAAWLATAARGVIVHSDNDPLERGQRAASALRRNIKLAGGTAHAFLPSRGKDAADAATGADFGPLPDGWDDYARTLRAVNDWPRWEIARESVNRLSEVIE